MDHSDTFEVINILVLIKFLLLLIFYLLRLIIGHPFQEFLITSIIIKDTFANCIFNLVEDYLFFHDLRESFRRIDN